MKTYIKTDSNGTRYYEVTDICPRCGGRGDYIIGDHNFGTCFECGGSRFSSHIEKEYTPEHEAKLEAERAKRKAKWMAKFEAERAEREAKEAAYEAEEAARRAEEEARKAISQHIGQVGDKVQMEVTLERKGRYEAPSYSGFGTTTVIVYTFVDSNGNKLVWKTSGYGLSGEVGERLTIKGTIKGHGEYKGEKQTELQRVKLA